MLFFRVHHPSLIKSGRDVGRFLPWTKPKPHLQYRHLHSNNRYFEVSAEVREAVNTGKPVVALESTIYTHGFPYPENLKLASHLESLVRDHGGVPATVGILDGVAKVGMTWNEMESLISSTGQISTVKTSRRDLAYVCGLNFRGKKLNGGTTVSGTSLLAHLAGIRVFATGGLGGVHRGGEDSMDVSADLRELGRTPIAVISSGCKSFLDIGRTLEYLETEGVGVATFADGRSGQVDVPAFFTRDSGFKSPLTILDEKEAAAMIYAQSQLKLQSGLLFANPIPSTHSIPLSEMKTAVEQAIQDAEKHKASGAQNTPYILQRIRELTNGRTTSANQALVEANVVRGTKVAVELSKMESERLQIYEHKERIVSICAAASPPISATIANACPSPNPHQKVDVLVAGSVALDLSCDVVASNTGQSIRSGDPEIGTSNPARIRQTLGGVGYNVSTAARLLDVKVRLCSAVASDSAGQSIIQAMKETGADVGAIQILDQDSKARTAQYVAVNNIQKDLFVGLADMDIMENASLDFNALLRPQLEQANPEWLIVDSNWSPQVTRSWLSEGKKVSKVAFEPVSVSKSKRLFDRSHPQLGVFPTHHIDICSPNSAELESMYSAARGAEALDRAEWWHVINKLNISSGGARDKLVKMTSSTLVDKGIPQQSIQLLPFMPCILTKLGSKGVLLTELLRSSDPRLSSPSTAPFILSRSDDDEGGIGGVYMRLFAPVEVVSQEDVVSVNGVGDTFLGVLVAALCRSKNTNVERWIDVAQQGSVMTLKSAHSVASDLQVLRKQLAA